MEDFHIKRIKDEELAFARNILASLQLQKSWAKVVIQFKNGHIILVTEEKSFKPPCHKDGIPDD